MLPLTAILNNDLHYKLFAWKWVCDDAERHHNHRLKLICTSNLENAQEMTSTWVKCLYFHVLMDEIFFFIALNSDSQWSSYRFGILTILLTKLFENINLIISTQYSGWCYIPQAWSVFKSYWMCLNYIDFFLHFQIIFCSAKNSYLVFTILMDGVIISNKYKRTFFLIWFIRLNK